MITGVPGGGSGISHRLFRVAGHVSPIPGRGLVYLGACIIAGL
jgi:hypothetical protein